MTRQLLMCGAAALVFGLAACGGQGRAPQGREEAAKLLFVDSSGAGRLTFAAVEAEGADHVLKDVVITEKDGGDEVRISEVRFAGLGLDGDAPIFSAVTFTGVSAATPSAEGEDGTFEIASIALQGPNADAVAYLRQGLAPAAAAPAEDADAAPAETPATPKDARFDAIVLSGLEMAGVGAEADTTKTTITIGEMRLDAPTAATSQLLFAMIAGEEIDPATTWAVAKDHGFGAAALSNLAMTITDPAAEASEPGEMTFALGDLRFEGVAEGRADRWAMTGLSLTTSEFQSDQGPMAISLGLGKAEIADLLWLPEDLKPIAKAAATSADQAFAALVMRLPSNDPFVRSYSTATMSDFTIDVGGVKANLDESTASITERGDTLTHASDIGSFKVTFDSDRPLGAQASGFLTMMGYTDGLTFDGGGRTIADKATGRVSTTDSRFSMTDGFTLTTAYDLGGIREYIAAAADLAETSPSDVDALMQMYAPLVLHGAKLDLADQGLLARGFKLGAAMTGQTEEALRQQAAGGLAMAMIAAPPELAGFLGPASTSLQEFIAKPGSTLTVTIAPPAPLKMADLVASAEPGGAAPTPASLGYAVSVKSP